MKIGSRRKIGWLLLMAGFVPAFSACDKASLFSSRNTSPQHPNEPAGYSRFLESELDTVPSSAGTCSDPGIFAGCLTSFTRGGGSLYRDIVSDGTAPESPSNVFQFTFPTGLTVGNSEGVLEAWDTTGDASTEFSEFYDSTWFRIPSADFEVPGPGMKLLGYWGVGERGSQVPNQVYSLIDGGGPNTTAILSAFHLTILQQNNVNRRMSQNRELGAVITCGPWHHVELVMKMNDVDVGNGTLRVWVDGVLTHEYTDVMYRTSAANSADGRDGTSGFYGRIWEPVWGGYDGSTPKTRNDYMWVDHMYFSGIRK